MNSTILRIRSRDGLERVTVADPHCSTVSELKSLIQSQLGIPIHNQTLSMNQNLLLAKSVEDHLRFTDMANPYASLYAFNLTHGSIVFLAYDGERTVAGPAAFNPAGSFGRKMTLDDLIEKNIEPTAFNAADSFGRKMTVDELIVKQMHVTRQEDSHCELIEKFKKIVI